MGIFVLVGIAVCCIAYAKGNAWMGVLGAVLIGIGVAGDQHGY